MSEVVEGLTDPMVIFALGLFGGMAVEALKWYKLRESVNFPKYRKSLFYWAITIVFIVIGGVLAWAYSIVGSINALLAINVGASAPLIITGFAKTPPPPPNQQNTQMVIGLDSSAKPTTVKESEKSNLREFLNWR